MLVDDLEERAADVPSRSTGDAGRAFEVLAVGFVWSLPGTLLGLLAAAISSYWPDLTVWFGVFGALIGAVVGVRLESAADAWDLPSL
jgi:hypothetical protein